jgi:hypothetical protein
VPGKHAWLLLHHPPRANGCLAPCGVRELAPAVCRPGLPGRAPRINLGTPISRLAPWLFLLRRHPACPDQGRERSFARLWFSRGFCGRETQSKDLSSIATHPRFISIVRPIRLPPTPLSALTCSSDTV